MKFKRFAIGLAIYILTILFIVFLNRAFNTKPTSNCGYPHSYPNTYSTGSPYSIEYNNNAISAYNLCNQQFNVAQAKYDQNSFLIIVIMSILAIIGGVLVMSVGPVSWGLILAGLTMILYIFIANFEDVGKPWRAVISGAALAILIWLSYFRLGDKEMLDDNMTPPPPPSADNPQNSNSKNMDNTPSQYPHIDLDDDDKI